MGQITSSATVTLVCGLNLAIALDQLEGMYNAAGLPSQEDAMVLNYMFFLFPITGVLGIFLGLFYLYITNFSTACRRRTNG